MRKTMRGKKNVMFCGLSRGVLQQCKNTTMENLRAFKAFASVLQSKILHNNLI